MSEQPPRGADLARIALARARAAAKQRGTTARKKPPAAARAARRGTGREPVTAMQAVMQMLVDRGYEVPAAAGSITAQWADVLPDFAAAGTATGFDATTGTLSVRPASAAYATQLRLHQRAIIGRLNDRAGRQVVKTLRVLAPGASPTATAGPAPHPAPAGTKTGPGGPPPIGFQDAKATARAVAAPADKWTAAVRDAADAQSTALRSRRPDDEPSGTATDITSGAAARAARSEDCRERARARAREEKAGRAVTPSHPLDRTA